MEVKNNLLVGVPFRKSPNQSGTIVPKFLIAHFTAASSADSAISWMLDPESKVSAHLHLDKQGNFVQLVEFNKRAYHAGKSEYKGVSDLNYHSIGIEIQNRGKINGVYEDYTEPQILAFIEAAKAIIKAYPTITEITGHENIAIPRGRKDDPGPKFPMERVRQAVFGGVTKEEYPKTKHTTTGLRLRKGPSTEYAIIDTLSAGTEVNVLYEKDGFSEVFVCGQKLHGWCSSSYLK